MCTRKCSKCIGITLFPLAACAIVSNILLYFPNGRVLQLGEITDLVWFFHGILGAGILVILPAFMMLGAGGARCCANRCGMLLSVALAVLGFVGGAYCAVISSLGLIGGPLCDTGDGEYLYPFRNDTLEDNYLFNQTTWSICKEPENIILWNVVLFSVLLVIGVIEAILCFIQVINGLTSFVCGTCMRRRRKVDKYFWNVNDLQGMPGQTPSYQYTCNKYSALCCTYNRMTKKAQDVQEFYGEN